MLKSRLKTFLKDEQGNLTILFVGCSFALLAGSAMIVDMNVWRSQEAKLQNAADAAALSGALLLGKGGHDVEIKAEETAKDYVLHGNDINIDGYSSAVYVNAKSETVDVRLTSGVPRIFSNLFATSDMTVGARAVAKVVHENTACLYVLDPEGNGSFEVRGSATFETKNCSIQVNSTSPKAISLVGNSSIQAEDICVAGGVSAKRGFSHAPKTACGVVPDPFASLDIPRAGACDYTRLSVSSSMTLKPGTYCGGIAVDRGSVVTLTPGIYIMKDGHIDIKGGGSIVGEEVAFVLEGASSIDVTGNGDVITTPPVNGPLAGFSVVQSSSEPLGQGSKIVGRGELHLPGTIYLPRQSLEVIGAAQHSTDTQSFATIVVHNLKIVGSGTFAISASKNNYNRDSAQRLSKTSARLIH
ncbi:pilus assembly protein TadG-related protein [Robiginitomaculum antarcticum]|uniref:pilus assembly protein TadG-related protein n=1 Tax=Robiginitomaculum antarcticum TaxID=437507 RepID=UPI0003793935|nr:pilus assembly protein TadG-related protein [Robiginitomaculum antarcticum]